jgi:hypothetical protein
VMVRRARSSTVNCSTSITAGQPNSAPPVHADMACSSSSFARTTADMDRLVGAAVAAHGGNARLGPHLGSIRVAGGTRRWSRWRRSYGCGETGNGAIVEVLDEHELELCGSHGRGGVRL